MGSFALLRDSFGDGVVDPVLWPQSYGPVTEAGGRALIPCTQGYAALWSAAAWSLSWGQISARVDPPAPGGASLASVSLLVLTGTAGTNAGVIVDRAAGVLGLYLRTGWADAGALFPPYDAVAHAWLRLREDAGTLYWEAAPDGTTWSVLRSAPSPAWADHTDLSLLIEAHRDTGVDDVAGIASLNASRGGVLSAGTGAVAALGSHIRSGPTLSGG
ncbi:hypothetical protein OG897_06175 [Streptomyces sp. NBC_00237]|uniref:hypothetical protein n=1 Tax=Streptomyces sp. NBC_00237 TaxID=2975687 RepID=UPI002251AFA4|nr:hypothetical protein [Streptomyces sp. NBC_00237]MCX5201048.1 hypothetical protein [Streptomyces sp. NBC_00237]